jgi:4-hydroxybenzoate polyprenyltransferase
VTSLAESRLGLAIRPRSQPLAWRLAQFIWERFPPLAYGLLIAVFVSCGYIGSAIATGEWFSPDGRMSITACVVCLVFFRMRVVDELKDAQVDRLGRPERPLPRGLVTEGELRAAAITCGLLELAVATLLGMTAFIAFAPAFGFSLLAARDFWLGPLVHRHPLMYALVHSPITPLLLGFVWFAYPSASVGPALASLLLVSWGVALGLEIARKTVTAADERPFVETYSAALGQGSATWLASASMAVAGIAAASYAAAVSAPTILAGAPLVAAAAVLAGAPIGRYRTLAWRAFACTVGTGLLGWPALLHLVERSSS